MSDDDLENDDLEVGDEDEADEGLEAAADDGAEDAGDDDSSPAPAAKGKSKAAVSVDEMPSMEPSRRSVMPWPRRWKNSCRVVARCRKSRKELFISQEVLVNIDSLGAAAFLDETPPQPPLAESMALPSALKRPA